MVNLSTEGDVSTVSSVRLPNSQPSERNDSGTSPSGVSGARGAETPRKLTFVAGLASSGPRKNLSSSSKGREDRRTSGGVDLHLAIEFGYN